MHVRSNIKNLSRSIAAVWKPSKQYYAQDLCTYNGLRYRALIQMDPWSDRRFNKNHWEFEEIGDAEGGGKTPIVEEDIPVLYTPDLLREKINALLQWARTPASTRSATVNIPLIPDPEEAATKTLVGEHQIRNEAEVIRENENEIVDESEGTGEEENCEVGPVVCPDDHSGDPVAMTTDLAVSASEEDAEEGETESVEDVHESEESQKEKFPQSFLRTIFMRIGNFFRKSVSVA